MRFQPPRGTRDFYPQDMAWRRRLIDAWCRVSVRHGFEEVDGPLFETLELYKVKSGEGIVNELFHFEDRGGRELAIRPEFTPTLARMVAARANSLTKPIKWFCVPTLCRAERPQRGRLREFDQWNVDILGSDSPVADAECILVAVDLVRELGLGPHQVKVKISHREVVRQILLKLGVADEHMQAAFNLLDARDKITHEAFRDEAAKLGLDEPRVERFEQMCRRKYPAGDVEHLRRSVGIDDGLSELDALDRRLAAFGLSEWCEYDLGIVRGLAYYTGLVFELHEATGVERALAGGGRYDQLIELFDGPTTPAVGFGMGDVVLTNILRDKGLLGADHLPRPDAFVIPSSEAVDPDASRLVAELRAVGLHARFTYKATRNVGKLLKEAAACRARFALIVEEGGSLQLKNLDTGEQQPIEREALLDTMRGETRTAS